jgi:hypothetical protein
MALDPIEVEKDGKMVKTDLQAVTDGVIAQKAHELNVEAQGQMLQIATNEFLQGVLVADNKDIDPKVDEASQAANAALAEKIAARDARLEKVKGTVDQAMVEARIETLKGLVQSWEQDYAGHQAHVLLNENPDQVAASQLAMLVIEAAHSVAKEELDSPGVLESKVQDATAAVEVRVAAVEAAKAAELPPVDAVPVDVAPVGLGAAKAVK